MTTMRDGQIEVSAGDMSSNDPDRYDYLTERYTGSAYKGDRLVASKQFGAYLMQATGQLDPEGDREVVVTLDGKVVADCFFGPQPGNESHIEGAVQVHPHHRRRGIATAMYSWIEALTGKKMAPGAGHSNDAERLWTQPNRAFGSGIHTKEAGQPIEYYRLDRGMNFIVARSGGKTIGLLSIGWGTPEVQSLWVAPEFRRRGIAIQLWKYGKTVRPDLIHSLDRTDEGDAWARAVGGEQHGGPVGERKYNTTDPGSGERHARMIDGLFADLDDPVWGPRMQKQIIRLAMPSWRDRGARPQEAEALIVPDTGRGRNNSFEVFLYGQPHARRSTLAEAKQVVEEIYGPLDWQRVAGDKEPHHDSTWGPTSMFNDADYYLTVDRLPRLGTTGAYGPNLIARGLKVYVGIDANDDMVPMLLAGRATVRDILKLVETPTVGVWWGIMGTFGDLVDFEDYAWGDELLADTYEDLEGGEVSVVLVAKRPTRNGEPWDPEIHNPSNALMGNSFLEDNEPVELVEIRYNAGHGWKSLPATGIRTKASTPEIYLRERALRDEGIVRRLTKEQATELTYRTLAAEGFPNGSSAEVEVNAGLGRSMVGWYTDTIPPTPLVVLDPRMLDEMTVLHECAHIIRNGPAMAGRSSAPGTDTHDAQWLATFERLANTYGSYPTKRLFRDVSKKATAADLDHWRPTGGMFGRGQDTLDPRVFDTQTEEMRPDIHDSVMGALDAYWTPQYGDWRVWAKVYLAGSGASYWWDSDADMDILIGVDLDRLREARPANKEVADDEILAHLNKGLKEDLRPTTTALNGFETTWFVNAGAYDILAIHPYAAYDLTGNVWVVKPPVLPANWGPDSIPEETWRRCEMAAREAQEVLSLDEPERSIAGTVYFDWVHEGRRASYSAYGGGWLDAGNVVYQYLALHPQRLLRRLYLCKHPEQASSADAIEVASVREDVQDLRGREAAERVPLRGRAVSGGLSGMSLREAQSPSRPAAQGQGQSGVLEVPEAQASEGVSGGAVSRLLPAVAQRARQANPHAGSEQVSVPEAEVWHLAGGLRADAGSAERSLRHVPPDSGGSGRAVAQRGSLPRDGQGQGSAVRSVQHAGGARGGRPSGGAQVGAGDGGVPVGGLTAARTIDMTPPKPAGWKGTGIYEMDLTGASTHGCVATLAEAMGMIWPIGWLTWDKGTHVLEGVWVEESNRGNGIAKDMLEEAEKIVGGKLVDSGEYTPEGLAWAKKRGINPKLKVRTPANEMSRMNAQMHDALIGGGRIKRQVQSYEEHTASKTAGLLDDLPKPLGETPVPSGTIRCYHYTSEANADSIARSGLLERYARGDGNMGVGNEASAGVWAATGRPASSGGMKGASPGQAIVEFWVKPEQVSQRAEYPFNGEDLVSWGNGGYHHIIVKGDVPPQQIVAIHLPWHNHARYMQTNPRVVPTAEQAATLPLEYRKAYEFITRHQ